MRSLPGELLWLLATARKQGLRPVVTVELARGRSHIDAETRRQIAERILASAADQMWTDLDRNGVGSQLRFTRDGVRYVALPFVGGAR